MTEETPVLDAVSDSSADRSLLADLRLMLDNARNLAEAELSYQQARAAYAAHGAKHITISVALAAALIFFALMALALGLVLALSSIMNSALLATLCVVGGLLLSAALCLLWAKMRWSAMVKALLHKENGK